MASPQGLIDVYVDELRDLWSGNDQMQAIMKDLGAKASDPKLKKTLTDSVDGIGKHTETLKSLLEANGGKVGKELCRGMEGLVREAKAHALDEKVEAKAHALDEKVADEDLGDLMIIAQYQRMSHYGLAGFGTAAAYAKALGKKDDESKLKSIVSDIYKADEFSTRMAERLERAASKSK